MSTHPTYKLAGVMGWPIAHSRSPAIHNYWIQQHQLKGAYVLLPVDPVNLKDALKGLSALGFAGCNLTIPHKVMALPLVDRIDATAKRMGAINTIVVEEDGSLSGYNNDGFGYIQSLLDAHPLWRADAGPILVMGAGGAARAVIVSLAEQGAKDIRICNRTDAAAQTLAQEFTADFAQATDLAKNAVVTAVPWAQRHDAVAGVALLVNTTSQGMGSNSALDVSLAQLPSQALVSDIVYIPQETPLLTAAKARGNPTAGGLGMLLHQARPAFKSWFGVMPEVTPKLRKLVESTL
ncbi:MAG TPA: shikimate dehydrogenase [Burkholderiaceae bacterium]|nr:shikimate dehydrogenase [Burkholderiaceae bacterium]